MRQLSDPRQRFPSVIIQPAVWLCCDSDFIRISASPDGTRRFERRANRAMRADIGVQYYGIAGLSGVELSLNQSDERLEATMVEH